MRRGNFAVWQGQEFEAVVLEEGRVRLIYRGTQPPQDFTPSGYARDLATFEVTRDKLEAFYEVTPMAVVAGQQVELAAISDGGVEIRTQDAALAQSLGMLPDGQSYRKVVPAGQVERLTERKRVLD